ncbi:MAG: DNA polymerase III subunit delta [Abitibacteriaceae bacterium]|nr:DNA polymerase III subunit delta [Abditibacteriaceae bacterium]
MLAYSAFTRAKAVPKSGPHRVYGVLGDAYLQKLIINALLEWTLSADARDFNLDTLDGETTTVTDVLARAGNLPFLSDFRGVLVQRAERLEGLHRSGEEKEGAAKEKGKQSPVKHLADGLENLPETTVLILARTPETPEPGARAGTVRCVHATVDKVIEKHGLIIDCTVGPKNAERAIAVVNQEAARRNIPLADGAAEHLVGRSGYDIAHLLNEMEKCALRAGIGEIVTPSIIDEMTKRAAQETIFDLTDALGERKMPRALGLLRELTEGGEAPELILVMLVRHFRQLLQARTFLDARLSLDNSLSHRIPPQLAQQLPQDGRENLANLMQSQPWLGRRLAQQARNFSVPQLETAMRAALAADLAMKGIEGDGGSPEMLLELLVAQLS